MPRNTFEKLLHTMTRDERWLALVHICHFINQSKHLNVINPDNPHKTPDWKSAYLRWRKGRRA